MAKAILSGSDAACKNPNTSRSVLDTVSSATMTRRLPFLLDAPGLTPDGQLRIFELIDESGSASMADLVAALEKVEEPARLIVDLVTTGVLEIDETRLMDGASLVRRAKIHGAAGVDDEPTGSGGKGKILSCAAVVDFPRSGDGYEPSIFFVGWDQRGTLQYNPTVNGAGVYLGVFDDAIHVGMSTQLHGRLRNGKHVLYNGQPPHTLVVITEAAGQLGDGEARALERRMALAVVGGDHRELANQEMPKGHQLARSVYEAVDRLAEKAVAAIAELGLAFTEGEAAVNAPQAGTQYRLDACGIKATATQTEDGFVVHEGSQVRLTVMPSAGDGPVKRRHELLTKGAIVREKAYFALLEDLVFSTASGATAFVLGSRHHPGIWTALPPDPAPPRA